MFASVGLLRPLCCTCEGDEGDAGRSWWDHLGRPWWRWVQAALHRHVSTDFILRELARCLINAQPLPAHSPAANDNSLIGCTSHDFSDDWSLARMHFVDSHTHFGARLGAFFYWTRCFENNVPFDNTASIYLINLLWKLGLGIFVTLRVAIF